MLRGAELEANITATNNANDAANKLQDRLLPIFAPLVGQNLFKVDGSLLAKIAKLVPDLPYTDRLRYHREGSSYVLSWTVTASENYGDSYCTYARASARIGLLENGVLTSLIGPMNLKTDYQLAEVLAARETAKEAERVFNAAKGACDPFGM
jgi:hypothetical protein